MTLRERAWSALRSDGPMTAVNLAGALAITRDSATDVCHMLAKTGFARRSGDVRQPMFEALGDIAPKLPERWRRRTQFRLPVRWSQFAAIGEDEMTTVREQIWRYLKDAGPTGAAEIAKVFGRSRRAVANACYKLAQDGFIERSGPLHAAVYEAIGDVAPVDTRGRSDAARAAIRESLPKARAALAVKGQEPSSTPCALADAWPMTR